MGKLRTIFVFGAWLAVISSSSADTSSAVQVFSESTSFESFVRDGQRFRGRKPASIELTYRVISVRRELALTNRQADKTPQDIVINGGIEEGISEGMTLKVVRKVPVIDPFLDNRQRELEVQFATVKVIHSQPHLSVARVEKITTSQQGVGVGIRGVLIGDYLTGN